MLSTFPDRSGANASGNVIGIPGEHLFLARRTRSDESDFSAAQRCVELAVSARRQFWDCIGPTLAGKSISS